MNTTFKDKQGREWRPRVTMLVARKYREKWGEELFVKAFTKEGIAELFGDTRRMTDLLWLSIEDQAAQCSPPVTQEDLLDEMDGDEAEAAFDALYGAMIDAGGGQAKKVRRLAWEKALRQGKAAQEEMLKQAEAKLLAEDLPSETSTSVQPSAELPAGT